ncbi:VanW family protein [Bacillus thermocopriae]|uniref:VanW family protein n=1 Tax=Neobacillus thermocopriae TaxID=1215031 RepID=A0A6B3TT00_9BACI|nr:VanW family protein [Neobacillus thermocopriae]MED3623572.1 VanW family protein [Neobacillus thermocopriae]MED3714472.1 VanW family protein [Neobacillus thermocopriae]NEX79812.1 VanW family protein [Neobacillus thermocopriae]
MGKRKCVFAILLMASFVLMTGCTEKTANDPIANKTKPTHHQKQTTEKSSKKEEPKQMEVKVIDPRTKSIVRTIHPSEMGFHTDKEKYRKELENWAKELARGTETTPGIDQRMVLDRIDENGQIIKGKPQVILKESELVEKVMEASVNGGEVELPIYVTESEYKPEDIPHLDDVVLASFSTYFNSGVVGRSKNIELSAQAINNVIVGVNDIFSFNTMVGPGTAENGYQPAKEIINKKLVDGIGGGICQTSSTLFNSIDQLGVKYIEWHNHSLSIGYVPAGRDATVAYGVKDFRFQNTTGVPLLIKTIYGKGKLTVEIRTSAEYQALYAKSH